VVNCFDHPTVLACSACFFFSIVRANLPRHCCECDRANLCCHCCRCIRSTSCQSRCFHAYVIVAQIDWGVVMRRSDFDYSFARGIARSSLMHFVGMLDSYKLVFVQPSMMECCVADCPYTLWKETLAFQCQSIRLTAPPCEFDSSSNTAL